MNDYGMSMRPDTALDEITAAKRAVTPAVPTFSISRPDRRRWPLQRILFLLAGAVTLTGVALGATVSGWFLLLPAMAGANQLLMVAAGWCPMSLLLTRIGVQPSCP
jgi:hypothetical protein